MRCKILSVVLLALTVLISGCSTIEKVVYRPDINQGNYLNDSDVAKLQKGMNKQQVSYLLGTPMMQDPFGSNTWIYVFRQQPGHENVTQRTLTLTFDSSDTLANIQDSGAATQTP